MKYLWKLVGIGGIMFGLGAGSPVLAQGITCFGSVQAGATMSGASISTAALEYDGLNSRSRTPDIGIGAGCDLKISGPWKVGVFGDYTWRDVSNQLSITGLTINVMSLGNTYTLGGRGIYELKNGASIYGLIGYTDSEISFVGSPANLPSSMKGITLGAGVGIPLGNNLSLEPEIRFTRYEKIEISPGINLQHDTMSGVARLKLSF